MPQPLILVVDDEKDIVKAATMFLRHAGYRTIAAFSGYEALEVWDDEVSLLLTDWAMHDLFGDQLATQLLERKRSLKVLFMSGNPVGSIESGFLLEEGVNFIQKPFSGQALLKAIRQLLDQTERQTALPKEER